MRKIINYIIVFSFVLNACEPAEIDIQKAFDFEISSSNEDINYINTPLSTEIEITPERSIEGVDYYLSFNLLNDEEGYFKNNADNSILIPEQEYLLESFILNLEYYGQTPENHLVEITIRDSNDLIESLTLNYNIVEPTDFYFNVVPERFEVFYTEDIPVHFELGLIENELMQDLTFDMLFESPSLQSKLIYNDIEYIPGQIIQSVPIGNFDAIFRGVDDGSGNVIFTIIASNGNRKNQDISLTVKPIEFELETLLDSETIYKGFGYYMNFNILENFDSSLPYSLRYSTNNRGYRLLYNGACSPATAEFIPLNEYIPIGQEFRLVFDSCAGADYTEEVELTFHVKNETLEKEFSRTIAITPYYFDFSISYSPLFYDLDNLPKQEIFLINYNLILQEFPNNLIFDNPTNYRMRVSSSLQTGTIKYFGESYGLDGYFDVSSSDASIEFTSGASGQATITIEIQSIDTGITKTRTLEVNFID